MSQNGSEARLQLRSAITKWTLCGVFVFALALGQAGATVITDTFPGWPPAPFIQQDKTWGVPNENSVRPMAGIILQSRSRCY